MFAIFVRARITRISCIGKLTASPTVAFHSLKIWPDLRVFFIADPTDFLQIVSAPKGSCGDDSRSDHMPNSWHGRELFLCRRVDVDLAQRSFFLSMRSIRLGRT